MSDNGQERSPHAEQTMHWSGRVLALDDLRHVNGHRRIVVEPRTVITPLAVEDLRHRGVEIQRQGAPSTSKGTGQWGVAEDRTYPQVRSAMQAMQRENQDWRRFDEGGEQVCRWTKEIAECIARGECCGGAIFCNDPGLVCCVANKVAGMRAVAVSTIGQAAQATLTLGSNLLVVEMPGRTYFEIRQILRELRSAKGVCPPGVACTLEELENHANR